MALENDDMPWSPACDGATADRRESDGLAGRRRTGDPHTSDPHTGDRSAGDQRTDDREAGDGQTGDRENGGGLSWSWELDLATLLATVAEPAPWNRQLFPDADPIAATRTDGPAAQQMLPNRPADHPTAADHSLTATTPATTSPATTDPATTDPATTDPATDPAEVDLAEYLDAVDAGRSQVIPLPLVAGRVTESLPPSPDLACWLAVSPVSGLEDGALAGMAASYRRLASWAQAGELAVVAELASRSAGGDPRIGVDRDGRPARLPEDAFGQVSLALTMSQASASWWTDLAVTLRWRLSATGKALRSGAIDLARARAIADATALLDEAAARAVEDRVLARAGDQTLGQLRAALRRAVITADPRGAERRRQEAERRAKVVLYPDAEGTASLAGYSLPGVRAAAAMSRVTALARALKASGAGGGIDLLRAQVFLGLLLGTLPYIPPAPDGPPDGPPDDSPPDDSPPDDSPPDDSAPDDSAPDDSAPDDSPPDDSAPAPTAPFGTAPGNMPGQGMPGEGMPGDSTSGDGPDEPPDRPAGQQPGEESVSEKPPASGMPGDGSVHRRRAPADVPGHRSRHRGSPGDHRSSDTCLASNPARSRPGDNASRAVSRSSADQTASKDHDADPHDMGDGYVHQPTARPPPTWPPLLPFLLPGPAAMGNLRPAVGGLLDLRVPWTTLTGESAEPGYLSRLGHITPAQASYLANLATRDQAADWHVIVTGSDGQALAVARVPRPPPRSGWGRAGRATHGARQRWARAGDASPLADSALDVQVRLVRRITVTISHDDLSSPHAEDLPLTLARTLTSARKAAEEAATRAAADAATTGNCAHLQASSTYRPSPRLHEYIAARDLTCRYPTCRQPAWRCDLDHTQPYDQGGKTCACNLGGLCRYHHKLKQRRGWRLAQPIPGTFLWTTPAGRGYVTSPDSHAA